MRYPPNPQIKLRIDEISLDMIEIPKNTLCSEVWGISTP